MHDDELADVAKALGHPVRLRIVRMLAEQPECRGADLFAELPLAQSTVSQHLSVLKEAGLVDSHSVGTGMVYCLVPGRLEAVGTEFVTIARSAPGCAEAFERGANDE